MGRPRRLAVRTRTTTTTIAPTTSSVRFWLLLVLLLGTGAAWEPASKRNNNYNNHHNINVKALPPSSSPSCVAADGSIIATSAVIVSTSKEATQVTRNLLRCPGSTFEVEWRGSVPISEPLTLSHGTTLKIVGSQGGKASAAASVQGHGVTALFELNGASLRLEGLALTGGNAAEGGAVAARGNALVTFVDCEVYQNVATSNGGERAKDRERALKYNTTAGKGGGLLSEVLAW